MSPLAFIFKSDRPGSQVPPNLARSGSDRTPHLPGDERPAPESGVKEAFLLRCSFPSKAFSPVGSSSEVDR